MTTQKQLHVLWRPEDDPLSVWWAQPGKGSGGYMSRYCEDSQFVSSFEACAGRRRHSELQQRRRCFLPCCIIVAPRIACSLVQISYYISLFDEVRELAVQSLPN